MSVSDSDSCTCLGANIECGLHMGGWDLVGGEPVRWVCLRLGIRGMKCSHTGTEG